MRSRRLVVALCAVALLGACANKTTLIREPSSPAAGLTAEQKAVQAVIVTDAKAENAKDGKAMVALWTDKGLRANDQGTREEILSGTSHIGEQKITIVELHTPTVSGRAASIVVDAAVGDSPVATPLFRVQFDLILNDAGTWLIDNFIFKGSPPPAKGTKVVAVKAIEYGFSGMPATLPASFGLTFTNGGKQLHEMTLFRSAKKVSVVEAQQALGNVNGQSLDNVPAGYEVNHITFAEPGQSQDVSFAKPLKPGTYVFACYIPDGGLGPNGPVNPNGKPHIQLGMIAVVEVG